VMISVFTIFLTSCKENVISIKPSSINAFQGEHYLLQNFGNMTINKDNENKIKVMSGTHSIFESLTIEKGCVLNVTSQKKWWDYTHKWAIIEVMGDLNIEGSILANDWIIPDRNYNIVSDTIYIRLANNQVPDKNPILVANYAYDFSATGGDGGATIPGWTTILSKIRQAQGAKGSYFYGGGGGGGHCQDNSGGNSDGANAEKWKGGLGRVAESNDVDRTGGNGGDGGLNINGVGGLLIILCHGSINLGDNAIIDVSGKKGEDGHDGQNAPNTSKRAGGGGGGGAAPGRPGGELFLSFQKINRINFDDFIRINGGDPGQIGIGGTAYQSLLHLDSMKAADGQPSTKGKDGVLYYNGEKVELN